MLNSSSRNKVLKVGVTGGIGSGKSVICQVFTALGIPVYNADKRAIDLINTSDQIREQILKIFGAGAYANGHYNRSYISDIVFKNKALLKKLNAIVHPQLDTDFYKWTDQNGSKDYIILEAAILFESEISLQMDKIVSIHAPLDIRIQRVMERDRISEKEIQNRIDNQWPPEKINSMADWVVINDGKKLILPQILKIHKKLISLNQKHS